MTRQVPVDCRQPIWFQASTWDRNGHFCTEAKIDFYRNQDTPVYMCFLDAKKACDRVNHWTLAKTLLDGNVPLHIVKLFIFWYREQESMVRWCNSPSMTLHCRRYVAHMLGLMTLYTTQRKQHVCWSLGIFGHKFTWYLCFTMYK